MMTTLILEMNSDFRDRTPVIGNVLFTPPVGQDYWIFRVKLGDKGQAIQAFPKFFTIGIGFAQEEDWNTNLPASSSVQAIWRHIKHNKGDESISDEDCIRAIEMVRDIALEYVKTVLQTATR